MGNVSNGNSFTVERKLNHVVPDPDYDHEMSLLVYYVSEMLI